MAKDREHVEIEKLEPFLEAALEGAIEFRDRIHQASGEDIRSCPECWVLVDGDLTTVRTMDDEDLKKSVVEELLNVRYWEMQGKTISFVADDLVRLLPADLHERVRTAYSDPFVQSLLAISPEGQIRIHQHHLQDAMDFAGVWHEDFEPLTDQPVYSAGI